MNLKRFFKGLGIVIAALLVLFAIALSLFIYETEYKITELDRSVSPDGGYTLLLESIGDPDFPFGLTHIRLVLKDGQRIIAQQTLNIANDGGQLLESDWSTEWEDDCVVVTVRGQEQADTVCTIGFDGGIKISGARN